jgi:hypothetical protein
MLLAAAALPASEALAKKKHARGNAQAISKTIKKRAVKAPVDVVKTIPGKTIPGVTTAAPTLADEAVPPATPTGDKTATEEPAITPTAETDRPPPPRIDASGMPFKLTGDSAVDAAYETCEKLLAGRTLEFNYLPPIRKGSCGTERPVAVRSFGKQKVKINPPATMNCAMLAKLDDWFERSLQGLARKHLRSPIARIDNATSYDCRNRYGDPREKLSEHAKANALDMAGFITASGLRISVAFDWGPNLRDMVAMAKAAKEAREKIEAETAAKLAAAEAAAKAAKALADAEVNSADPSQIPVETASITPTAPAKTDIIDNDKKPNSKEKPIDPVSTTKSKKKLTKLGRKIVQAETDIAKVLVEKRLLGRAALGKQPLDATTRAVVVKAVVDAKQEIREEAAKTPHKRGQRRTAELVSEAKEMGVKMPPPATSRSRFLHGAHSSACKFFGTILGPEANAAHADHFHVDLTPRNGSSYCQ